MAKLTIAIGPLTAELTATDAKANTLITQYANSIGAIGTNQQKLNAVVQSLAHHMQQQARQHRSAALQMDAVTTAQPEIDGLGWG